MTPQGAWFDGLRSLVRDERLLRLARHWRALQGGRLLPDRRSLDPILFHDLLAHVWMADVVPTDDGPRFRYRLVGEEITGLYGQRMRGRFMDEVIPERLYVSARRRYHRMARTPQFIHSYGSLFQATNRDWTGERLVMPLGAEGRTVDTLLGVVVRDAETVAAGDAPTGDPTMGERLTFIPVTGEPITREVELVVEGEVVVTPG